MPEVSQIVKTYRQSQKLSLRKFADALIDGIPGETLSHGSVANWEQGTHSPEYYFLIMLTMKTGDWRYDFAVDLLSVLKPDLYEPMTAIGRGERSITII